MNTPKEIKSWNLKLWLQAALCVLVIFSTIPVARAFQRFIYSTVGREFFTYFVVTIIFCLIITLLYFFLFRLRVKRVSQYLWLTACSGFYIYMSIQLREHPEEAIHILEYGLLAFFLFRALNHRINDWTVYLSAGLLVLFAGTMDEFLQWLMPERFWSFRDVGINTVAGGILLLALHKGIRSENTGKPVKKHSVKVLSRILVMNLIFLTFCLSNTPGAVQRYTEAFHSLSWLRHEEHMTEYGFKHTDPKIGIFYSRFPLEKLSETDLSHGSEYGRMVSSVRKDELAYEELIRINTPATDPFLYEFLSHLSRRDKNLERIEEIHSEYKKSEKRIIAYRSNLILEKYFFNTLRYAGLTWPDQKAAELRISLPAWEKNYTTGSSGMITAFSLRSALTAILILAACAWIVLGKWRNRLGD
jgi:hypothetical protein